MNKKIKFVDIAGSNVTGYSYNKQENKLYVRFKNERTYCYDDVNQEEFDYLLEDDEKSFGKKLIEVITKTKNYKEIW